MRTLACCLCLFVAGVAFADKKPPAKKGAIKKPTKSAGEKAFEEWCTNDTRLSGDYELDLTSIPITSMGGNLKQCTGMETGKKVRFRYRVVVEDMTVVKVGNLDQESTIRGATLNRAVTPACDAAGHKEEHVRSFGWKEYKGQGDLTWYTQGIGAIDSGEGRNKVMSLITMLQDRSGNPICYAKFDNLE